MIAIKKENTYDYVICGGGASGLLLAKRLSEDSFFADKRIALIEKNKKDQNDRTWCFWEAEEGVYDDLLHAQWQKGFFGAPQYKQDFSLAPFTYKMLRSKPFYRAYHEALQNAPNIDLIRAEIIHVQEEKELHCIDTSEGIIYAHRVFSSLFDPQLLNQQQKYPVLQQHFMGWIVTTEKNVFDPKSIHFMDFDIPQKGATRFIYILPFSPNKALVEYTLFSKDLLDNQAYEGGIKAYLDQLDCGNYTVLETEKGSIPMTSYRFDRHNRKNFIYIGTAGGWTKASTGFTFKKTTQKVDELVTFLKTSKSFTEFWKPDRFWFYDLLFLDVLAKYNAEGHQLFRTMFEKNSPALILKFLDEKTSFWEEIRIMTAFPIPLFLSALWKRLF